MAGLVLGMWDGEPFHESMSWLFCFSHEPLQVVVSGVPQHGPGFNMALTKALVKVCRLQHSVDLPISSLFALPCR